MSYQTLSLRFLRAQILSSYSQGPSMLCLLCLLKLVHFEQFFPSSLLASQLSVFFHLFFFHSISTATSTFPLTPIFTHSPNNFCASSRSPFFRNSLASHHVTVTSCCLSSYGSAATAASLFSIYFILAFNFFI